jgi:metallo-beta-lactamase family protein
MAIRATNIFSRYVEELSPKCQKFYRRDGDLFFFPRLHFTVDVEDSKRINDVERGAIIIAGSGMCTGGRILHHFKHHIWNKRNTVIFVGYQAEGTIGRQIVDGARWIKLYNEKIRVKAKIYTINGFSAHADQNELLSWMGGFKRLGDIYLVHGEPDKEEILKKAIKKRLEKKATIVEEGKAYRLDPEPRLQRVAPKKRRKRAKKDV